MGESSTFAVHLADHRSPAWHEARRGVVAASEIAAVLGLSPWTSPFDLWWQKKTGVDSQPDNPRMRRGRRLERLVLDDFAEAHPHLVLHTPGLCVSRERPWQACTPDALAYESDASPEPIAVVEAKTDHDRPGWGDPGTDQIPVHYRCQVLWQMDVTGCTVAHVPMWMGDDYREYVVEWHAEDVALMRTAAREFLDTVAADRPPPVDAHAATTRRLRHLHPDVDDDTTARVGKTLRDKYLAAVKAHRKADARLKLAQNQLRAAMGDARHAYHGDDKVATRSVYDVAEHVRKASHVDKLIPALPREKRTVA